MNADRMQQLTKDLVSIDSVTENEGQICDFMLETLQKRGMKVRAFTVDGDRRNILAGWQNDMPRVLFNTHLDTVPVQYGPHEDDKRIYGRGACDTHGILAAQLEAIADLHHDGIADCGILLVVGEEAGHDGAIHAGKSEIREPDFLIVGEPTENKLMRTQKGSVKASLFVQGREGHSGYPENFDSATEKLVFVLEKFRTAPWLKKHSADGTTVNITIRSGGDADNKVPPFAHARLMFRCAESCTWIKSKASDLVDEANAELKASSPSHIRLEWDAAENDPINRLSTLPGYETGEAAYNTDIAYFGWKKARTFLLGPGSILQAHLDLKEDNWDGAEWLSKEEQKKSVEIYKRLVADVLKS